MSGYIYTALISLFVGFAIGYVICGIMSSGECQDCRLKELKEFEDE